MLDIEDGVEIPGVPDVKKLKTERKIMSEEEYNKMHKQFEREEKRLPPPAN